MKKEDCTVWGINRLKDKCSESIQLLGITNVGKLNCNHLIMNGILLLGKRIDAKSIVMNGMIRLKDRAIINGDKIAISGIVVGEGRINCKEINIDYNKSLKLNAIHGLNVRIKKTKEEERIFDVLINLIKIVFQDKKARKNYAVVTNISCETISADCLIANHIRAKNVSLSSNCVVDLVEYTDTFTMDQTCTVRNIRKIKSGKEVWKKQEIRSYTEQSEK